MVTVPRVTHDESAWPVVVATMPPTELSIEDTREMLEHVTRLIQRGERFAMIIDVRKSPPISAEQRRMIAETMDRNAERYPDSFPYNAVVLSNAVQRGILKALQWLTRSRQKLEPFTDLENARSWALRALAPAPPARRSKTGST